MPVCTMVAGRSIANTSDLSTDLDQHALNYGRKRVVIAIRQIIFDLDVVIFSILEKNSPQKSRIAT